MYLAREVPTIDMEPGPAGPFLGPEPERSHGLLIQQSSASVDGLVFVVICLLDARNPKNILGNFLKQALPFL